VEHYDQSVKKAIEDSLNEVGANASAEEFNTALSRHLDEIGVTPTKVELKSGRVAF
jgi:hypothetical protein